MIKTGYTLYATFANGTWFKYQAKSPSHFVSMCVGAEKASGWHVQPKFRQNYNPDFRYDEARKAWVSTDDGSLRSKLPCDK